jgi:hypothetical protein
MQIAVDRSLPAAQAKETSRSGQSACMFTTMSACKRRRQHGKQTGLAWTFVLGFVSDSWFSEPQPSK